MLEKERLRELNTGLKKIVPLQRMKSFHDKNRISPSELLKQKMIYEDVLNESHSKFSSKNLNCFLPSKNPETEDFLNNEEKKVVLTRALPVKGSLEELRSFNQNCMNCSLGAGRTKFVFGCGSSKASLMFIGEGPGADEDAQGEPFVGRAGKLLTKMIQSIGIERSDVYITNVVKCRPPKNRNPEAIEVAACMNILENQLKFIERVSLQCGLLIFV